MCRTVILASWIVTLFLNAPAFAASCPPVAGPEAGGKYPHIFELQEFQDQFSCALTFSENPRIADLNALIAGNPGKLPPVSQRLPEEPLVVAPYREIGRYGGVLDGISKATEAGTSDLLSVRHVNLFRFSDDLQTVVPHVAKGWKWNDDFTQLTIFLRKGHKWSDGRPFTADDVVFWYENLVLDPRVIQKPKDRFLSAGQPWKVEVLDPQTVRITLSKPNPGLVAMFANDYAQPFQPKHLLGRFHPKVSPDADALAQKLGFVDGYDVVNFYYGQSDWKDVPSPLLKDPKKAESLVKAGFTAVAPTLESHVLVQESLEGRRLVANPYFFQVDTAGHQLPYINEIREVYIGDEDVQTAKMIAGEVDYKAQSVNLPSAPVLLENRERGGYEIALRPTVGMVSLAFNLTDNDEEKRSLFNQLKFRRAMSLALDREAINRIAYLGLGKPAQFTFFDADTAPFVTDAQRTAWTRCDPDGARRLLDEAGLKDRDGDGWRDLPSGRTLDLVIHYATQGAPTQVMEIVAENWRAVGVKTSIKEVTSDEYRNSQSANDYSVVNWTMGRPPFVVQTDPQWVLPPYGTFFDLRTGMLWARYLETDGKEGVRPPETVYEMKKLHGAYRSVPLDNPKSREIGRKIAQKAVDDLFILGTVKAVAPIYYSRRLRNFQVPKTSSYDYYRVYPYLPSQWYLAE